MTEEQQQALQYNTLVDMSYKHSNSSTKTFYHTMAHSMKNAFVYTEIFCKVLSLTEYNKHSVRVMYTKQQLMFFQLLLLSVSV